MTVVMIGLGLLVWFLFGRVTFGVLCLVGAWWSLLVGGSGLWHLCNVAAGFGFGLLVLLWPRIRAGRRRNWVEQR